MSRRNVFTANLSVVSNSPIASLIPFVVFVTISLDIVPDKMYILVTLSFAYLKYVLPVEYEKLKVAFLPRGILFCSAPKPGLSFSVPLSTKLIPTEKSTIVSNTVI